MTDEVICGAHGSTPPVIACRHLCRGVACGFWEDPLEPGEARPAAWCDLCNEQRKLTAADLKVVCTFCWDEIKQRNERVSALARGRDARLTADEQRELIHHAIPQLMAVQDRAQERWPVGLGSTRPDQKHMGWNFSDETRTLTFSDAGVPYLVADVEMVGSHATGSQTFQWSWVTMGRDKPLVGRLANLAGFGEVRGIERLTKNWWECDQQEGWEMTALAAYLFGCDFAYRMPAGDNYWFMLLTNARVVA